MSKEAKARIKINELLKEAGWKFFDDAEGKANIVLENNVKITESHINALGENFEKNKNGFIDFLLLDKKGFPFIVLEAKSEDKPALVGKEQARKYAQAQHCRFIILSNGNSHYFWDTQRGNPQQITKFPSPDSFESYAKFTPNPQNLTREVVENDYIAYFLKSDKVLKELEKLKVGVAQYNISLGQVSDFQIPLPPLEIQREIVVRIEKERAIVEGNRELIQLYEEKVKKVIERVWEG